MEEIHSHLKQKKVPNKPKLKNENFINISRGCYSGSAGPQFHCLPKLSPDQKKGVEPPACSPCLPLGPHTG